MNRKETARVKFGQALYVPTFDPAHLVDGTYQVPVAILKSGKDEPSLSASFFAQTATVTVVGKTVTVTLHVIKNASMITDFSLGDLKNKATFSNQTKDTEDLTFDVNTNFKDAVVSATMTITIPGTNSGIPQPADVKFGQALSVGTTDPSDPGTGTTKPDQPTVTKPDASNKPAANTSVNLNHLVDGTYKLNAPIMQEGLETESIAQQFIDQTAHLIVSNNGRTLKVVFHVNKSLQNIKGMTLDKQAAQITNRHGDTADFVFSVTKATLAGVGQLHFDLTNDGTDFSEEAYVVFNLNHYSLDSLKQQTKSTLNTVASGNNLLDANKQVQYVPYKVFNESRSALSTANNYYTHTAKVVKDATGYKVYLTVQAPTGYVKFQPMTINNGGYSDLSQSSTAGNDVWSYAFHITSATGLDQPVPATIDMTVPIAGISQQQFEIWLVFGQAQSGGTDYLTPTTTAQALPVTTIALAQSATTAAKKTTLKAVPAVKKAAAKSATAAPAANSSMAEKLAKIKDYPFMAEIAGFSVAAIAIIGFAIFKRLH
ncbi:NEAT domain-containing protein [Loigolactobacillus zhaoyuanensis]|uniref:NEAT domain-containing protein n=1 Tax=Loigolactobacillus zhaoyuanensis TaxID=2486017 RepID=A0ABW8UB31_9LACO